MDDRHGTISTFICWCHAVYMPNFIVEFLGVEYQMVL